MNECAVADIYSNMAYTAVTVCGKEHEISRFQISITNARTVCILLRTVFEGVTAFCKHILRETGTVKPYTGRCAAPNIFDTDIILRH